MKGNLEKREKQNQILYTAFQFQESIPFVTRELYMLSSRYPSEKFPNILSTLIKDRSANRPIFFGTDNYQKRNVRFEEYTRMSGWEMKTMLVDEANRLFQPRAEKEKTVQFKRTKQRGEVLTPLWVINEEMIDVLEEKWKDLSLSQYLDASVLEICCGEAPFLVQRYDPISGELVPIDQRRGVLDRKLIKVSESTNKHGTWMKRTYQAYRSVYGYEYQGDSLFLGRENLLFSFIEHFFYKFQELPTINEINNIARIISWNLFQMDGLKNETLRRLQNEPHQLSLYGDEYDPRPVVTCWETKGSEPQEKEKRRYGDEKMKFDFVIGNPAYQEETTEISSKSNGQKPKKNIFQYFQLEVDKVTNDSSILIYPGKRWIHRSGKGMKDFGLKQINDICLQKIIYYEDANRVFPSVAIADGISIVIKDYKKETSGFDYEFIDRNGNREKIFRENPGEKLLELNPKDSIISSKFDEAIKKNNFKYLSESVFPRTLFNLESSFVEDHPEKVTPYEGGDIPLGKIKLFTNDKAGKSGRAKWFVADEDVISQNKSFINEWQVVVSSANAGGQKRDNQIQIIDNHSAFGRSRIALKSFKTEEEAHNFLNYMKSPIIRYSLLLTDENLTSFAKKAPDILDYTLNSMIDFTCDINSQLATLFNLNDEDLKYINNVLCEIRKDKSNGS